MGKKTSNNSHDPGKPASPDHLPGPDDAAPSTSNDGPSGRGAAPQAAPHSSFFEEHGISDEVASARPYDRWTKENRLPLREAYKDLPAARSFLLARTKSIAGWVINRYAPPGMGLPHVYAEIRPDEAVITRPKGWKDLKTGEPLEEKRAKYLFPPNRKKKIAWEDDHGERFFDRPEDRAKHVEKKHGGNDVPGPHQHYFKVDEEGLAKRIDVHPLAAELFEKAEVVYFGIEGCIKADAILTAILGNGAAATVCSVPSVTLWEAPELEDFAEKYLRGKSVYIVPDADWNNREKNKGAVEQQSLLLRTFLRRRNVDAHVAPPPGPLKGVDDFLAAGGSLDDLVRIERETPPELYDWAVEQGKQQGWRWDRAYRAACALEGLALHAADGVAYSGGLKTCARVMGLSPSSVQRGVQDLLALGAVATDRPLATKKDWFSKQLEWKDRPTITIRSEFRTVAVDPHEKSYAAAVRVAQELTEGSGGFQEKKLQQKLRGIESEKKTAKVLSLKRTQPQMPNREIGRRVGVDHTTVGEILRKQREREEKRMEMVAELESLHEEMGGLHEEMGDRIARLKESIRDLELADESVEAEFEMFVEDFGKK